MKACDLKLTLASARSSWRSLFKKQVSVFEGRRVYMQSLQDLSAQRLIVASPQFTRAVVSRVGLFYNRRSHLR